MKRRRSSSLAFGMLVLTAMALPGCLPSAWLRGKTRAEPPLEAGAASEPIFSYDAPEDSKKSVAGPRGFFKSTRLPGGLSSEAAEIEDHLGVGR